MQEQVKGLLKAAQTRMTPAPPDAPQPPVVTKPRPFPGFAHGLLTRTDQHGPNHELYEYLERRFKVAKGRRAQQRVSIGKDALIVTVLEENEQIISAFLTRQKDETSGKMLDWIVDQDGYSYQANAFNPKLTLPLRDHAQK